jgi:histone-lysine N-methyltransferase ASH1L
VFIGDAAAIWKDKILHEVSRCVCTKESGCDEHCFNRSMYYECDDSNCPLGIEYCTNRAFEGLKQRCKAGGKYNIGAEVVKTADKGYGVRANRTFEPHQIILEYTGEIITQEECDERMNTIYKDNEVSIANTTVIVLLPHEFRSEHDH